MIISITFDDCCASVATKAAPIFKEYGVAGTFFVCGAYVGKSADVACTCKVKCPAPVTLDQLHALKDAGWEIASHTYNHCHGGKVTLEQYEESVKKNRHWIEYNGLGDGSGFSYPWGVYTERLIGVVERYHKYARATVARLESKRPERYRRRGVVLSASTTLGAACRHIDQREPFDNVVFFGHRIGPERDGYTWSPAELRGLLDYCSRLGIPVAPMGKAPLRDN